MGYQFIPQIRGENIQCILKSDNKPPLSFLESGTTPADLMLHDSINSTARLADTLKSYTFSRIRAASPYIYQNLIVALGWHSGREPWWPQHGSETDRNSQPCRRTVSAVLRDVRVRGGGAVAWHLKLRPQASLFFHNKSRRGTSETRVSFSLMLRKLRARYLHLKTLQFFSTACLHT